MSALTKHDDFSVSAVAYAFRNISHLKRGYMHYFENCTFLEEYADHLGPIGDLENSLEYWKSFSRECGIPEDIVLANFTHKHVAATSSVKILDTFTDKEKEKMKRMLSTEYEIYNALKKMKL